jgi:hypothetical protein
MEKASTASAIPAHVALQLCEEIRKENNGKFRWTAWWCWGCATFCKGDPAKMCFSSHPEYRGCAQVNDRYDRQTTTK